ncbi:MAG: sulfite reductase subunit alpha, partial [Methylobacter sp.]
MKRPLIPDNAPYSDTQKAWLSGFFAGLHTHMLQNSGTSDQTGIRTVNILYGTQTGNAESVANDAAAAAKIHNLKPVVQGMDEIDMTALSAMEYL